VTPTTVRTPTYDQCARLAERGDTDAALTAYGRYLAEHPADPEVLNDVGTLLFAAGRVDEATVHLESAARRLGDGRATALWNLAEAYLAGRRPGKALGLFDALHREGLLSADLANRTATAFLDADDPGGAVEALLACRSAFPEQDLSADFVNAIRAQRPKVAFFCTNGDTKFLTDIYAWAIQRFPTRFFQGSTEEDVRAMLQWCDLAWFEWCNPTAAYASHLPKTSRILIRLHRFEAFKDWPARVNWDHVDALITVGNPFVVDRLVRQVPDIAQRTRVLSIPNGVNLERFAFRDRPRGKNVAMVGYLNLRKNPGLVLQAFARLHRMDPEYRLCIAGAFQDDGLLEDYMAGMIEEFGLAGAVSFDGWQDDVAAWLEDKHYVVSAAMGEGHPVNVLEAMARGLKPLVHTWPGARGFFPPDCLWRDPDDFCRIVLEGDYEPARYRAWVAERYSLALQLARIGAVFGELERGIRAEAAGRTAPAEEPGAANAPATRDARAFYEAWYRDAAVKEGTLARLRRKRVVAALETLGRKDLAILDLGCGLGRLEPHLVGFGHVTGVDLSEAAVRAAERHCPAATFVRGDIRTMQLPAKAFDAVTSVEVIEHFDDADQRLHLERARDLLVPGGLLVLTTPNRPVMEALNAQCLARDGRPWSDQPIENWLDADALRALAEAAGFAVERLDPFAREGDHRGLHLCLVARKPA